MRRLLLALGIACVVGRAPAARAGDDLDAARALHRAGLVLLEGTGDAEDLDRVREGLDALRKADTLYAKILADPEASKEMQAGARASRAEAKAKLEWWAALLPTTGAKDRCKRPEARLEDPAKGEPLTRWGEKAKAAYAAEPDGLARAAIAVKVAAKAGALGLPVLFGWFRTERDLPAREGVVDALVLVGGSDVAKEMGACAKGEDGPVFRDALEVICRCLGKPERAEPEKPFCAAIRRFHERKDHRLSKGIVARLDAMGWQGTAALGEVLYVDDFGAQDEAYDALARKQDARAVPPLVFRLDRFSFEHQEQLPAHRTLLAIGWYAVPELVDRLNDPAAGIWISWTLRKITGRHAGTDRKKWSEWWKLEAPKRPEIAEANAEPAPSGGTTPTDR